MPYQLVKDYISRDTVEALQQLLAGAQSGHITGVAFAAALKNRRYITNVAGTCFRDATAARGMVATLDDELSELIHDRDPDETR